MLDNLIIKYASPTLANIKTGSLFKVYKKSCNNLHDEIKNYNLIYNPLDLYFEIIYSCDKYYLIYIYRLNLLIVDINNKTIKEFLNDYNYNGDSIEEYITCLKNRFSLFNKTPHEIGVFLGYPLNDVKSFIKYKGKNFKICGCWKVYNNEEDCHKKFEKFKLYKQKFMHLYSEGYSLEYIIKINLN